MAVQVQVRRAIVGVGVQVPAAAGVAQQHRAAEPDEQQRDEEVRGGGEASGEVQAAEHDQPHDRPDARGVSQCPREPQPAGREKGSLPGGEGRHRRQVVGLEGVAQPEQQPDAAHS